MSETSAIQTRLARIEELLKVVKGQVEISKRVEELESQITSLLNELYRLRNDPLANVTGDYFFIDCDLRAKYRVRVFGKHIEMCRTSAGNSIDFAIQRVNQEEWLKL